MEFAHLPHFQTSLSKLSNEFQKQAKITAMDLQLNPANPGHQFHKIDRAKNPNFWTVRVSQDLRIVAYKDKSRLVLCYVGHHDDAYRWAQKRDFAAHPVTGGMQVVLVREEVKEIRRLVEVPQPQTASKPGLLHTLTTQDLLEYGVPQDWIDEVRTANEDQLLEIADWLPPEAQEAVLCLATGSRPPKPRKLQKGEDPFLHPDAQRTFRRVGDMEEFRQALEYPWEQWMIFLHPTHRELVAKNFQGPARVSGSAGTGKTIVALHRVVHLAQTNPESRILLTTFSETLANALQVKLRRLLSPKPRLLERIETYSMSKWIQRLCDSNLGKTRSADSDQIKQWLIEAEESQGPTGFNSAFLYAEWHQVVDAWQLQEWDEYRIFKRKGRGGRISEAQRQSLWRVFVKLRQRLSEEGMQTDAERLHQLTKHFRQTQHCPYDFVVVDEAQDISAAQLQLLSTMVSERENALFFSGDLGQQIFQVPFSWKSQGVNVQGRSHTLKVNYRTSHQIRMQADRLLDDELHDLDGNREQRKGTISLFDGPKPKLLLLDSVAEERDAVASWLLDLVNQGFAKREIGVFVRSEIQIERAKSALQSANLAFQILDERVDPNSQEISIATMHLAKGLEFRAVVVMACDEEVIPDQTRLRVAGGDGELSDIHDSERHLLYVACTRARERLFLTAIRPGSVFLEDLALGN